MVYAASAGAGVALLVVVLCVVVRRRRRAATVTKRCADGSRGRPGSLAESAMSLYVKHRHVLLAHINSFFEVRDSLVCDLWLHGVLRRRRLRRRRMQYLDSHAAVAV